MIKIQTTVHSSFGHFPPPTFLSRQKQRSRQDKNDRDKTKSKHNTTVWHFLPPTLLSRRINVRDKTKMIRIKNKLKTKIQHNCLASPSLQTRQNGRKPNQTKSKLNVSFQAFPLPPHTFWSQ